MDKRIFASLVVFLLVLSGCAGLKVGQTKEQAGSAAQDAHRGVKGVTMNFVRNNPPDMVFTGSPIDIVLELTNEGAVDVDGGNLYLSGFASRFFGSFSRIKTFSNLEGRSAFNVIGGRQTITYTTAPVNLPEGAETFPQTFLARICYPYTTEARIQVCIDPNPFSLLETEACRVTNPSVGGGQGAPVAVTAVREDPAPGQVGFLINIANLGDGQVVNRESFSRCPDTLKFNDVDVVNYEVRLSDVKNAGTCTPSNSKTQLGNNQGTIYCTFRLADATSPAYQTVLSIDLNYDYLSSKSKNVQVRSLNR